MKIPTAVISALLLLPGCMHAPKDHVTAYDFSSARLVDLPWEMGAAIVGPSSAFDYDAYVREHHPDWSYVEHRLGRELFDELSYVPEGDTNHVYTVDDPASIVPQYDSVSDSCRLTDGRLCHELECVDGVVTTSTDDWFKLEVEVLEYLDFNRDGYMDVLVLRRLPGSAAPWEELVLSRRGYDEPFYVVEHVESGCRGFDQETQSRPLPMRKYTEVPEGCIEHLVYPGDILEDVAREYGVTAASVRKINGLKTGIPLEAGTVLLVKIQE